MPRKIIVQALAANEVEVFVEVPQAVDRKPLFLSTEDARRLRDALSAAIKVQNCLEQADHHRRTLERLNTQASAGSDSARVARAEARLSAVEAAPLAREA